MLNRKVDDPPLTPGMKLGLEVTTMRLAIEIACAAIYIGKYAEARKVLLDMGHSPGRRLTRLSGRHRYWIEDYLPTPQAEAALDAWLKATPVSLVHR